MGDTSGNDSKDGSSEGTCQRVSPRNHVCSNKTGDISGYWLRPDLIQFIPQFRGVSMSPIDALNCTFEHHRTKEVSTNAPVIGCSLGCFRRRHELCTCPQKYTTLDNRDERNVSSSRNQPILDSKSTCNLVASGDYFTLPIRSGTEATGHVHQDDPAIRSSPSDSLKSCDRLGSENRDRVMESKSSIKEDVDKPDVPNIVRIRGRRLLCPKNATPLYGETPKWWGDSPCDDKPPATSAKSMEKHFTQINQPTIKTSKISTKNDNYQPVESQGEDVNRERRQSTAFVVNLENSEQSAKLSLSSSLPSFQIDDHLCSYFPLSRRMSLQKREAAIRRKESMASDKTQGSDAASESGTYVVELDLNDDLAGIDNESPSVKDYKSSTEEDINLNVSVQKTDFRQVPEFRELRNINGRQKKETKPNTKKVDRKKTFVVFTNNSLAAEYKENVAENYIVDDTMHEILKNNLKKDLETPHKPLGKSSETRHLSKESPWNFNNSDDFVVGKPFTISQIKSDVPKIVNKSVFEKKTKYVAPNDIGKERKKSFNTVTLEPEPAEPYKNFNKKMEIFQFDKNDDKNDSDDESNLLTSRSLQTELLLKPTQEISHQLKKSKMNASKRFKDHDAKNEQDLSKCEEKWKEDSEKNFCESMNSLERYGCENTSGKCNSEADLSSLTKFKRFESKNDYSEKSYLSDFKENFVDSPDRCNSSLSNHTDLTEEDNQSFYTDQVSLGHKIVQKSKSALSASTEKSHELFVPPQRKQKFSPDHKSTLHFCETMKAHDNTYLSWKVVPYKRISPIRERESTELLIRGNSAMPDRHRETEWQQKFKAKQKPERTVKLKPEKGLDNLSCLTAIMKYSAHIQLLSGNILELLSLRREKKDERRSKEHRGVDKSVSSRLSSMLSTMKASNDLLFNLHDFLIAEMDSMNN